MVFIALAVQLLDIEGYFASVGGMVAKIRAKIFICLFSIGFIAFTVLFLEHWRLFYVNWRYGCQDTGENIY